MADACNVGATGRIYTESTGIKPLSGNPTYEVYNLTPSFPIIQGGGNSNECGAISNQWAFKNPYEGCLIQNGSGGYHYGGVIDFDQVTTNCPIDASLGFIVLLGMVVLFSFKKIQSFVN